VTALYIKLETGGSAEWQVWPKPDLVPSGAIKENSSYIFELRDCDDAVDADLLIDNSPLEALRSRLLRIAKWRWEPGFHAGVVSAIIQIPNVGKRRFEITTDPDIRKLTRNDFDSMVRELLEDTSALFSISSFRKGISRQPSAQPPPLARLEFLKSRAEQINEAVAAIARSPRHFLQPEVVTLPAHRASRASGPEIVRSFRTGTIRYESFSPSRLPQALRGILPAQITMRRRRNSVDIPEHRQIKACLKSWAAWLASVADILTRNAKDDAEETSITSSWAISLRHISRQFNYSAGCGFMVEVGDGPAQLQMSAMFRSAPQYQSFYRLWQDMNLGLSALFGDFLQMPLARTYELYELWCFMRLVRAAVEEYGVSELDLSRLFIRNANGGITIAASAVAVQIDSNRMLCFQKHYREYWIEPDGQGSFSRTMVPDIVLSGKGLGSSERRVIVLDAKYRINDSLNDALNSIHTYRDALVQEAASGITEGIVSAAYLLTPHLPKLESDFQGTAVPGRLFHPKYREKFRFGAVTLRPGMSASDLRHCLQTIVQDATAVMV
jgi:hypothetical protein